ncbi:hypothetical protein [Actinophytocola oryzae]|uniref:Uncharacterized protein n=1 Tax=Actinophytocola oryzae TaxID=502181 RepID=A0A4R7VZ45_9PSEU|nr:hypothetical protein [Actinophytocola oryzae]TDV54829.1 hypothetical protein CLV71_10369 [Actinophytocola oryzae]
MSTERFSTKENANAIDATGGETGGTGFTTPLLRFLPAVTFGLRTAALAGMVVSAGAVALGLTGVFDDSANVAFTTCCEGVIGELPQ